MIARFGAGRFQWNGGQPAGSGAVFGANVLRDCGGFGCEGRCWAGVVGGRVRGSGAGGGGAVGGEACGLAVRDSILDAGKFAGFGCLSDGCADGVEIDVGEAGGEGGFIEQWLGFETGFPEVSGDVVFAVGAFGDGF